MDDGTATLRRRLRELSGPAVRERDDVLDVQRVRRIVRRRHRRRLARRATAAVFTVVVLVAGLGWVASERPTERTPPAVSAPTTTPAVDALFDALRADDRQLVERLLSDGADPNAVGPLGTTPLTVASFRGSAPSIRALIDAGADPAGRNDDGTTALHAAAQHGHVDAVRALARSGAPIDPDAGANDWITSPLMRAAAGGHAEVVRALIDAGADASAVHRSGRPAVLYAFDGDDPASVVDVFVDADAIIPHPSGDPDRDLRLASIDPDELVEVLRNLDRHGPPDS